MRANRAWNHAGKSNRRSQGPPLLATIGVGLAGHSSGTAWPRSIFAKGGEAQLPATTEGYRVVVATPEGKVGAVAGDIRKLVPGFWPPHEWAERRRNALAGGFDGGSLASGGLSKTA